MDVATALEECVLAHKLTLLNPGVEGHGDLTETSSSFFFFFAFLQQQVRLQFISIKYTNIS